MRLMLALLAPRAAARPSLRPLVCPRHGWPLTSRRAHSSAIVSSPDAPGALAPSVIAEPFRAAQLRALTVRGVVDFVRALGVSGVHAEKLAAQEVDGAALLELSVDALCDRCALPLGPACTIMRAIELARSQTLTIHPPKKGNTFTVKLTPEVFRVMFNPHSAPLRIANSSGSVLRVATSLADAVGRKRRTAPDGVTALR